MRDLPVVFFKEDHTKWCLKFKQTNILNSAFLAVIEHFLLKGCAGDGDDGLNGIKSTFLQFNRNHIQQTGLFRVNSLKATLLKYVPP